MNRARILQSTAMLPALAVGLTFALQRPARANDTTAIIGAVIAGALVYEALDDDGPNYRWGPPGHVKHYRPKYKHPNRFDRAWGRDDYRGYATPFPRTYRPYDGYYAPPRDYQGLDIGVRTGPRGTSVDLRYQGRIR